MAKRVSRHKQKSNSLLSYVGVACMLLAVCAYFFSTKNRHAQATTQTVVVAEYDTIQVPVVAKIVSAGTPIEKIEIRMEEMPSKFVNKSELILDPSTLSGKVSLVSLASGIPLYRKNFTEQLSQSNPVIENIPQGMRAMTIKVDATSSVEGWAGTGSLVDVLLVEKSQTTVVAESVKILSAERSVAPVEGKAAPNVPSTVTLLVSQEQCLAINTAIPRGKIAFALRSTGDGDKWRDKIFTPENLLNHETSVRKKADVNGYIEVKGKKGKKIFTLSNGKWLNTAQKPEGFLVGDN